MIQIEVNIKDRAMPYLNRLVRALSGETRSEINEHAGRAAMEAAVKYHQEFDRSGGWRGKYYTGSPSPNGSSFGAGVAHGWSLRSFDQSGAMIANDADYYRFKVEGGTITPKRAGALTIPLVPEAKGLYARAYTQNTGHKLFTIRGKHALFERLDQTVTGTRGKPGQAGGSAIKKHSIRSVYALVKSITTLPWKGALPPFDSIRDAFRKQWEDSLRDITEQL